MQIKQLTFIPNNKNSLSKVLHIKDLKSLRQMKQILQLNPNNYQIYRQKQQMKAQNRRAFQNVMRSPSPDIAHRSIITSTKPPVNQIKDFMRIRQASKSPNAMNSSLHQNNKPFNDSEEVNRLKRHIQELQARIKFLQRIKISHQQLTITNQRLNNELEGLKLQLRDNQQRSQSNSSKNISPNTVRNKSPRLKGVSLVKNQLTDNINISQPNSLQNLHAANVPPPADNILREFNERIVKMSEENIRLGKKLKDIYDQKDQLEKENSILKSQKTLNLPTQGGTFNDVQSLKRYFTEETDRITKYYQGLNESRMSQLGVRINALQNGLGKLPQRQNKRPVTSSPKDYKDNGSNNTYSRTQSQEPISSLQPHRYMSESKYTTTPSEFRTPANVELSPRGEEKEEKEKMKRQNEDLYRRTMDVEGELKMVLLQNSRLQKRLRQVESSPYSQQTATYKPSPLQESNMSTYRVSQQRIQGLQHELMTKTTELSFKSMKIEELERRLREISGFRDSQTQNQMKVISQQRQKTLHYLKQLEKCQQRLSDMQRNTVNKQQFLLQQIELNRLRSLYQQSQTQYSQLKTNFSKYLEMVMEIRHSLTGKDMEECLKEIENKWTGYDELEMEIIKVHECHQMLVQQFKQNILQKEQKIAILEKQNLMLKEENQQNLILVQKLQKAIYDFSQPPKHQMTQEQIKKRLNHHQTSDKKSERPCLIRDYINRTDHKLGILENQINAALQFQQEHKNQNLQTAATSRNKYPLNSVEVESIYRKSTQTLQQEGFSDGEQQYEEEHEDIPDEYELMGKD